MLEDKLLAAQSGPFAGANCNAYAWAWKKGAPAAARVAY